MPFLRRNRYMLRSSTASGSPRQAPHPPGFRLSARSNPLCALLSSTCAQSLPTPFLCVACHTRPKCAVDSIIRVIPMHAASLVIPALPSPHSINYPVVYHPHVVSRKTPLSVTFHALLYLHAQCHSLLVFVSIPSHLADPKQLQLRSGDVSPFLQNVAPSVPILSPLPHHPYLRRHSLASAPGP